MVAVTPVALTNWNVEATGCVLYCTSSLLFIIVLLLLILLLLLLVITLLLLLFKIVVLLLLVCFVSSESVFLLSVSCLNLTSSSTRSALGGFRSGTSLSATPYDDGVG